ncbi:MAG: phytoene/squalene synthase family protein [Alphaproteobacteria bacterium]|nr:phytoene/squalene synthase family protein [Alphaproteobacteria bacterium]
MDPDQDTCLALLREGDRDRYLCALLTPGRHRGAITALYAFNLEIARIRDVVTEPMMGEVRLQWWNDLIENPSETAPAGHPVAESLVKAIDDHDLPRQTFLNMIAARQFDLYDDPMPDRNTLEGYAGETASALIHLCTRVLDTSGKAASADAAGHAGVAQLIAGLLLLLPLHRSRGQLFVPGDILKSAGLDRESFLAGKQTESINQALLAFVALGREHLRKAREFADQIPADCFAAYLSVCFVEPVLDRAERSGATLLESPLVMPQWRRQIRLWNGARKRRF